jgi:epoxyqueuosine reductase
MTDSSTAEEKPRVLLHICCAPDATASVERLRPDYQVVGFFFNPNIFPEKEYQIRLREAERVAAEMEFSLIIPPYVPEDWEKAARGLEREPEKGYRCRICFLYNLRATAREARSRGIEFFTTTLTISPHKVSSQVFEAGRQAAEELGGTFLDIDFKKKNGFRRSLEISRCMSLYRQKYCGCRYSMPGDRSA